jgi:hypothetical protein
MLPPFYAILLLVVQPFGPFDQGLTREERLATS